MKTLEGDLIALTKSGTFDVMVHGCNCFCTMGAGIAKVIASQFPEAFKAGLQTVKGDREKLGSYSSALITDNGHNFHIVNAYTQYKYNGPQPRVSYDAVTMAFQRIATDFAGLRIGYPLIGAGLAGGDWSRIATSLEEALSGMDHSLVILPGTKISKVSK